MTLASGFQFNQGNLQDYLDCQRRFQLRHLLRISWPSLVSEPAIDTELYLQLGTIFHFLIRQHLSKVPQEQLSNLVKSMQLQYNGDLSTWWENYTHSLNDPEGLASLLDLDNPEKGAYFSEYTLSSPLEKYRVLAKFDLIVMKKAGSVIILDWKTNRYRPRRHWLQERLQSHIYPYIVVKAGKELNNGKIIAPEQVKMCYWFANFPNYPEYFDYSTEQYQSDEAFLINLIQQIDSQSDFPLTHNEDICAFCAYRSLCERGVRAGSLTSSMFLENDSFAESTEINFQQIDEIEF